MKFYVELFLVAILLVLMYEKPESLVRFVNSTLGKVLMLMHSFAMWTIMEMVFGCISNLRTENENCFKHDQMIIQFDVTKLRTHNSTI